ncbi:hypothetical protein SMACR_07658 [Sordaria macrospora]|uniref:WGS project CABT00000000 data, contig 2.31 n=2 Tax=Sordaria macrospora TaxID=5147 RepID=F7W5M7_SORMK|nr:uncharacterized protein SMAC_07658 [Sordaria macrospora k-hell]KAA8635491.1 hypothetical protein SMACR_07658 [Sordaria macrospora]WPJ66233.1 hypothetical protein SMAC4_07658 [Sordaria macrospora]CCC12815.1 unnamed protein product [Sordaria macrospora k-hell]
MDRMDRMDYCRHRYEGIPSPSLSPEVESSSPARARSPPRSPAPAVPAASVQPSPIVSASVVPVPSPPIPSVPVVHDPFLDVIYGVTPTLVPAVNRIGNRMHLDNDPLGIGAELMDELAVRMGYFNGEVYVG